MIMLYAKNSTTIDNSPHTPNIYHTNDVTVVHTGTLSIQWSKLAYRYRNNDTNIERKNDVIFLMLVCLSLTPSLCTKEGRWSRIICNCCQWT